MADASLPEIPKGVEFEEYVAALYQAGGFFVERDLTEREGIDVLQLDAIVTDYGPDIPQMTLVEAKSGTWRITDIFKLRGWMHYLGVPQGALVTCKPKERLETYLLTGNRVEVDVLCVPELDRLPAAILPAVPADQIDTVDVTLWRFYYWLERQLLRRVVVQDKSATSAERFGTIREYASTIHEGVFFTDTISERVNRLYEAFGAFRNVSARAAVERDGEAFPQEAVEIPANVFRETFYESNLNEIQTACMVEHRSRLAVLKAAVDYLAHQEAGDVSRANQVVTWTVNGKSYSFPLVSFPRRFEEALEEIADEPYFRKYPVFWQWFMGVFGGFILLDYEEAERALLSEKSGIPLEALDAAFAVYDKLFPIEGGWFRTPGYSNIQVLMLFPCQLRGIGANYRRIRYSGTQEYTDLELSRRHTLGDLIRWNNAAVEALNWNH